jgi:putative PIN family toxin of toxin-antitoxin system
LPTLRVVIDTNVLVSGLAYPDSPPGRVVEAWRKGSITLVSSSYILDELARVLPRLNHRLKWKKNDFADFIDILAIQAEIVEPETLPDDTARDASDIPIVGTLIAAKADYLVTGDRDLLELAEHFPIGAPAEFIRKHGL